MNTKEKASDDKADEKRVAQQRIIEEKPFDFIERTKPEDRIDGDVDERAGRGQLTRDNVNPAIPSAKPGEGGIIDPKVLGMESQAGEAPPKAIEPKEAEPEDMPSINEPPGSDVNPYYDEQMRGQPQTRSAAKPAVTAQPYGSDPDDLEDEIEAAEDDDDVDVKHGSKPKKKK